MKEINISLNKPCFCNSGKKFKLCHGLEKDFSALQSYKLQLLLKEVYLKYFTHVKKTYDINSFLEDFMLYNNISKENISKFTSSLLFIDFLIQKAQIEVDYKDFLFSYVSKNLPLSEIEAEFLSAVKKSKFTMYILTQNDINTGEMELENLFTKKKYLLTDKIYSKNLKKGELLYGRLLNIFDGIWLLPTFNVKKTDDKIFEQLDKIIENFEKRFDNVKKEDETIKEIDDFINSIEYELYGGENPYQIYEYEDKLEKFLKENPDKNEDDFLDLYEEELLGLK